VISVRSGSLLPHTALEAADIPNIPQSNIAGRLLVMIVCLSVGQLDGIYSVSGSLSLFV